MPSGTSAVAVGLAVLGVSSYLFLVVAARALGPERFAPLSALWAVVFIVGPGMFLPLEQEVARLTAARRVRGDGSGPVFRKGAAVAGAGAGAVLTIGAVAHRPLLTRLFNDEAILLLALGLSVVGFAAAHLVRGGLSAHQRFTAYGAAVAAEGLVRLGIAAVAWAAGSHSLAVFAVAVSVAPLVASFTFIPARRTLLAPGEAVRTGDFVHSLAYLLAASAFSQILVNAGPIAVKLLAEPGQETRVSQFLVALVVSRIPLFLFQAVQATFLPELAALAGSIRMEEFRRQVVHIVVVVAVLGGAGVLGAALAGPEAIRLLFGGAFALDRAEIVLLATSSAAFLGAVALAQPLIALGAMRAVTAAWLFGVVSFAATLSMQGDVVTRVALALVAGCVVATLAMGRALVARVKVAGGVL